MSRQKHHTLFLIVILLAAALSLGGCKRQDTKTDTQQQYIPAVGGQNSPLPTPGDANSPVNP